MTAETAASAAPPPMPDRGAKIDTAGFRYSRGIPEGRGGLVALPLDAPALAHSRGPDGAFADVRVVADDGSQVPYLLERRDEPLAVDLPIRQTTPQVRALRGNATGQRSFHAVALPYAGLPASRLVLETSERVFRRTVHFGVERAPDRQRRERWFEAIGTTVWAHADPAAPAPPLELRLPRDEAREILLMVEEGDNRPLPITAARLLLPSWRLRFFRPAAPLRVVYGRDDIQAPQYDLALLAPAVMNAAAEDVAAAAEAGGDAATPTLLSPRVFWIGLGIAVLVLLALIVRLISSASDAPPAPPRP